MSEDEQGLTKKQIEKLGKELEEHPIMNPKKLMVEDLKQKLKEYLQKRRIELLREQSNVAINIGKYDMALEVLEWLKNQ